LSSIFTSHPPVKLTSFKIPGSQELKAPPLISAAFVSAADLGRGLNFVSGFHFFTFVAIAVLPSLDSFSLLPATREICFTTARFTIFLLDDFDRFATAFLW
jgi:hypothetical protein